MGTKKRLIEKANKKLLNESLPGTMVHSMSVLILLDRIFNGDIPDEAMDKYWEFMGERGFNKPDPNAINNIPPGAYM